MPLLKNEFTIGMPHMVPGQLSEVELVKFIGDFQWLAISKSLNVPAKDIVNDIGERLYASFINLDLDLGGRTFSSFKEGAHIRVKHRAQFFARRFAEGFFYFDDKEFPDATLEEVSARDDLRQCATPWIYLTNALVTRETSNLRLRTFAPSTEVPDAACTQREPDGLADQKRVQSTNVIPFPEYPNSNLIEGTSTEPFTYPIVPESDLNGAGLLYFARYIAVMNYGERHFLQNRLPLPVSTGLIRFLSTEKRRIFYFANADETDNIAIYVSVRVSPVDESTVVDKTQCARLRFVFSTDLYRVSDGTLMAKSVASRVLGVPWSAKGIVTEAERLQLQLGV